MIPKKIMVKKGGKKDRERRRRAAFYSSGLGGQLSPAAASACLRGEKKVRFRFSEVGLRTTLALDAPSVSPQVPVTSGLRASTAIQRVKVPRPSKLLPRGTVLTSSALDHRTFYCSQLSIAAGHRTSRYFRPKQACQACQAGVII